MKLSIYLVKFLCLSLFGINNLQAADMKVSKPEKMGMSSTQLAKLNQLGERYVENGHYAGVVLLVARNGNIVHESAHGSFSVVDDTALQTDTLFRIYSMTKPITAAATLMLYEEGLFHLDDPIERYLPEMADLKVWDEGKLSEPKSKVTIRQLLTHTAGFTYGWMPDDPVDQQYAQAQLFKGANLAEFSRKLATLPLRYEPGTRYHYSVSFDVLGALIERLSGQGLDEFFQTRILTPLAMNDTFFELPKDKESRLAGDQTWNYETNKIDVVPVEARRPFQGITLFNGGGGLISTARDYLRFSQMILNGGTYDGQRLLSPKTIELMGSDQLTKSVRAEGVGEFPALDLYHGQSMALGYGVVTDPQHMPDLSSQGELSWGGVAGTKFWIDPKEKLIGIALVQLYQSPWPLRSDFKTVVYTALDELY